MLLLGAFNKYFKYIAIAVYFVTMLTMLKNHCYQNCQTLILFALLADCLWYGTTFCDGDVVEDLYRWWFKMKCSKTRFSVDSSSWAEVIRRKKLEGV